MRDNVQANFQSCVEPSRARCGELEILFTVMTFQYYCNITEIGVIQVIIPNCSLASSGSRSHL